MTAGSFNPDIADSSIGTYQHIQKYLPLFPQTFRRRRIFWGRVLQMPGFNPGHGQRLFPAGSGVRRFFNERFLRWCRLRAVFLNRRLLCFYRRNRHGFGGRQGNGTFGRGSLYRHHRLWCRPGSRTGDAFFPWSRDTLRRLCGQKHPLYSVRADRRFNSTRRSNQKGQQHQMRRSDGKKNGPATTFISH